MLGFIALIAMPWAALVAARNRNDLEKAWYGLVVVGIAAAIVAFTVQIGFGTIWLAITTPAPEDVYQFDLILLSCVLPGLLLEACKVQGLYWFQDRLNRGNWVLHGFAVGAGSGIVQAIWLCGAVAINTLQGQGGITHEHLWLLFRCGALIAMETAITGTAMLLIARGRSRSKVVFGAGAAHGALRLLALIASMAPCAAVFGQAVVYALTSVAAGLWLRREIERKGWPV